VRSLNKTYDPCQEPACLDGVSVRVIRYDTKICLGANAVIDWTVDSTGNIPLVITAHRIKWSINSQDFDREVIGAAAVIGGEEQDFYTGNISTLESDIPGIIYFNVEVQINNKWIINEEGVLVISLRDCTTASLCEESQYYIEYETYNVRDQILVVGNYNGEDSCTYDGDILWDSGCVATCRGEGAGWSIGTPAKIDPSLGCTKADCFTVQESDLPIGVIVNPNCEGTTGTLWKACIKSSDSRWYCLSGEDTHFCDDLCEPGCPGCSQCIPTGVLPSSIDVKFNFIRFCSDDVVSDDLLYYRKTNGLASYFNGKTMSLSFTGSNCTYKGSINLGTTYNRPYVQVYDNIECPPGQVCINPPIASYFFDVAEVTLVMGSSASTTLSFRLHTTTGLWTNEWVQPVSLNDIGGDGMLCPEDGGYLFGESFCSYFNIFSMSETVSSIQISMPDTATNLCTDCSPTSSSSSNSSSSSDSSSSSLSSESSSSSNSSSSSSTTGFIQVGHINIGSVRRIWTDVDYNPSNPTIYAANDNGGLYALTFDGSNFNQLDMEYAGNPTFSVYGDGTYIYSSKFVGDGLVANEFSGNKFVEKGSIAVSTPYELWHDGDYLYAAAGLWGLIAYTFNGAAFNVEGTEAAGGVEFRGVWGDGTYIYGSKGNSGIYAYTFDGTNFNEEGSVNTSGFANSTWGDNPSGLYIYQADDTNGMSSYLFDGSQFSEEGNIDSGGSAEQIWGDGTYIYLANNTDGLRAYTFDGTIFTPIANVNSGNNTECVYGDGTYIYMGDSTNGLYAYTLG
jgi:hypothetical protein